jgi:Fungal Zn(2)-Cys(6) binuclear cluster domain
MFKPLLLAGFFALAMVGMQACFSSSSTTLDPSQPAQAGSSGHTVCDAQGENCQNCDANNTNCQMLVKTSRKSWAFVF